MTNKLLVILGPTSTGKTDLALKLAKEFDGELVACDSRQVYKDLDIGTGKLPGKKAEIKKYKGFWEINGVKIWMYDVVSLKRQYTVADYVRDANIIINEIIKRGKLPIIVGGTGLYLKALLEGLPNLAIPFDKQLREELIRLSLEELQEKLKQLSLPRWKELNESDQRNPRRLLRSIELITMNPYGKKVQNSKFKVQKFNLLTVGLTAQRQIIYQKINGRVLDWIRLGIIEEVKSLIAKGISKKRIRDIGLEYAVIAEYLNGFVSFDRMIEKMQIKVRQYAKRQITWFKKEENVSWFDITDNNYLVKIENLVSRWYDSCITYEL